MELDDTPTVTTLPNTALDGTPLAVTIINSTSPVVSIADEEVTQKPVALTGNPNFTVSANYIHELDDPFDYRNETVYLPSATTSGSKKIIDDIPSTKLSGTTKGKEWISAVNAGRETTVYANGLEETTARADAQFVQGVTSPQGILSASFPSFKSNEGTKYTGERALLRFRQAVNIGSIFNVPLWHSGFWIRIKSPSEGDLLEVYRQLTAEKITLGRATYGFLFSNNTAYSTRILLDFCIDNMYESSLNLKEGDSIKNYINILDLPIIFWALACSVYPNGFQYTRGCISNPEKCNHIVKEKLDLSKLQWTDSRELTAYQINHMTKRQRGSVDPTTLERYHDEFIRGQKKKITLSNNVDIILRVPNALEHIDASYRWVNTIEETYGKALIQDESKRDDYLLSQGKSTMMRQYSHFVESISAAGDVYDDRETIEEILNVLTASDKDRSSFMDQVVKYIDDSVISLIAIPTYKCPSCGGEQVPVKERPKHPNLIPLDVTQMFFSLVISRINKIEAR